MKVQQLSSSISPSLLAVVSLSTLLIVFNRYPPQMWTECGEFLQQKWEYFLDNCGYDEDFLWTYGSTMVTLSVYWTLGLCYIFVDITNKPAFLMRYKIQPGTNEPIDKNKLFKAICQALFNQIVIGIPATLLSYRLHLWTRNGVTKDIRQLPTCKSLVMNFIVLSFVFEVFFYYSHRLLHTPMLYRYIHKYHHKWQSPVAITAINAHPVEYVFANMLPPIIGLALVDADLVTTWLWLSHVLVVTLYDHSGYHLPFCSSNEFHNFHHLRYNVNYGTGMGLLDRFHGTDVLYRESPAKKRDFRVLGLTPVREIIADDTDKKTS